MTQTSQSNKFECQIENEKIVNGVNVTKLIEATDTVKSNREYSKFNFSAKGKWADGGHNFTTINEFYGICQTHRRDESFIYQIDEPPVLLGKDKGANPVEYVLTSLNGCLITTFIYLASEQGVKVEEVETSITGNLDILGLLGLSKEVRNGYEKINVVFRVKSNAPKKKIKELVELAQQRSPVFDIITNPTPVHVVLHE